MKKIVLVSISIFLLIIAFVVAISKTIVPIIKNANYEREIQKRNEQLAQYLQQQEQLQSIGNSEEEYITNLPQNDGQRVGMYIGDYIKLVNSKEYEKAYALLNIAFKEKYFPTLESYTLYVKEKYKDRRKSIEYNKFRLEGLVYVVDTTINDLPIYGQPESFNQVFRFQETEPGKFNISFGI